jgi:hypothetical protein
MSNTTGQVISLVGMAGAVLDGLSVTLAGLPEKPSYETTLEMLELFQKTCKSQAEICQSVVAILKEAK